MGCVRINHGRGELMKLLLSLFSSKSKKSLEQRLYEASNAIKK